MYSYADRVCKGHQPDLMLYGPGLITIDNAIRNIKAATTLGLVLAIQSM